MLVVSGQHDLPGLARLGEELAVALPRAKHVTIAGSAHCPSMDRPEELSRLVLDFLSTSRG